MEPCELPGFLRAALGSRKLIIAQSAEPGRVGVVTGAAKGIGRGVAEAFALRGDRVVVADVDDTAGAAAVAAITAAGGTALYVHCDLRQKTDVEGLMAAAVDAYGGIDVLVNNAGVVEAAMTADLTVDTLPDEVWDTVYEVNLRGTFWAIKAAASHLRRSTRGPAIVNAGSVASFLAYPAHPVYAATKAGVIALTKSTALDLSPAVRCNAYAPAAIDTPMIDSFRAASDPEQFNQAVTAGLLVKRLGSPKDVANLVCFLSSDESSFITGTTILIEGGSLAWRGQDA